MAKDKAKNKKESVLKDWVPLHGSGLEDGLVRENNTGRQGERRTFIVDPIYDPKNEDYIYKYRRDTKSPLVSAYGSEVLKKNEKDSYVQDRHESPNRYDSHDKNVKKDKKEIKAEKERKKNVYMTAVTEHIPHRLSDTPQLTFGESLYTLDRSLEGYETAYEKCGPMWMNDRMVGYTPQGYAKVWVNQDFANNHPAYPRRTLQSTLEDRTTYDGHKFDGASFLQGKNKIPPTGSDEADFVENIVDVVADHTQQGRYPEPFRSQIHQRGLGFREARKFVRDYATTNNIFVPDRVDFWRNRTWGWRNTRNTKIDNHYVPQQTVIRQQPTKGYRFNYLPPDEPYHPDIFASRMGEHGVHHGHRY